jgi:hypothetical protein
LSWERTLWKKLEVIERQRPGSVVLRLSTSDLKGMFYLEVKNSGQQNNLKPQKAAKGSSTITSDDGVL